MIKIKPILSDSDKQELSVILSSVPDIYGDFYITLNNIRLFIRENLNTFLKGVEKGDLCAWDDEGGIIAISGISDNSSRCYVKVLASSGYIANNLVKAVERVFVGTELYAKIKKNNPLVRTLQYNGFVFAGGRGKEILLKKEIKKG